MKKRIKQWIKKWLEEDESEFTPKFAKKLNSVSFESKQPLGNKKYLQYLFQCTEWSNGEGYDLTINIFNEFSKSEKNKTLSLHSDEINGVLSCLDYLNYFKID